MLQVYPWYCKMLRGGTLYMVCLLMVMSCVVQFALLSIARAYGQEGCIRLMRDACHVWVVQLSCVWTVLAIVRICCASKAGIYVPYVAAVSVFMWLAVTVAQGILCQMRGDWRMVVVLIPCVGLQGVFAAVTFAAEETVADWGKTMYKSGEWWQWQTRW